MCKIIPKIILVALLLFPVSALASTQVLMGGNNTQITSNSAARFTSIFQNQGGVNWANATANATRGVIMAAGTLKNLTVGSGSSLTQGSYTAVLFVNGAATAVTCVITFPAQGCNDASHSVAVVVGDRPEIRITGAGTPALIILSTSTDFVPTNAGDTLITSMFGGESTTVNSYAQWYERTTFGATETAVTAQTLFPSAGTMSFMAFNGTTAPGAGTSFTFAIRDNSATTTVTCPIANTNTACTDLTHSFSVSDGDFLNIVAAPTGAVVSTGANGWGTKFNPSVIGDFVLIGGAIGNEGTSGTNYLAISGGFSTTTLSSAQMVSNAMMVKKVELALSAAPGTGKTRTYTLQDNGVNTGVTCPVADTAKTCTWNGQLLVNQGDLLNWADVITGTATNAVPRISILATRLNAQTYQGAGYWRMNGGRVQIK